MTLVGLDNFENKQNGLWYQMKAISPDGWVDVEYFKPYVGRLAILISLLTYAQIRLSKNPWQKKLKFLIPKILFYILIGIHFSKIITTYE